MLTKSQIQSEIESGGIFIDPMPSESAFNPNSVNLRLGLRTFAVVPELGEVDSRNGGGLKKIEIKADRDGRVILRRGTVYLSSTFEATRQRPGLIPRIDGRSSGGRMGLWVHITAGFGDNGFAGNWTLELYSAYNIAVWPGQEICQISWVEAFPDERNLYTGAYANSALPVLSKGLGQPKWSNAK